MIDYSLWNGGVHATQLEAGDLCPFTIPAFTSDFCVGGHLELDVTGAGSGAIGSPLDPSLSLELESTSP